MVGGGVGNSQETLRSSVPGAAPGFTGVQSGRYMIPQEMWEAKALGKGPLRQSNAGQNFLENFKAPRNAGQLHIQSHYKMWRGCLG